MEKKVNFVPIPKFDEEYSSEEDNSLTWTEFLNAADANSSDSLLPPAKTATSGWKKLSLPTFRGSSLTGQESQQISQKITLHSFITSLSRRSASNEMSLTEFLASQQKPRVGQGAGTITASQSHLLAQGSIKEEYPRESQVTDGNTSESGEESSNERRPLLTRRKLSLSEFLATQSEPDEPSLSDHKGHEEEEKEVIVAKRLFGRPIRKLSIQKLLPTIAIRSPTETAFRKHSLTSFLPSGSFLPVLSPKSSVDNGESRIFSKLKIWWFDLRFVFDFLQPALFYVTL